LALVLELKKLLDIDHQPLHVHPHEPCGHLEHPILFQRKENKLDILKVCIRQPFNGLQEFPEGSYITGEQDQSLFEDPPPEGKKGGSLFRIKCDDNGYNNEDEDEAKAILESDMARAIEPVPRDEYKGEDFAEMSAVLNGWLEEGDTETRACDEWTTEELQQLQAMLYLARESKFDHVYQGVEDNRRMRKEWDEIERDWAGLTELMEGLDSNHVAHSVRRDGHCHEAVMWYVHHLTEDVKKVMAEAGVVIPLLSMQRHEQPMEGEHEAHHAAHAVYGEQVTCSSCHAKY
jgi:hypothetical protein